MNCACFPEEKTPDVTKRVKFMNFSFRTFFWFGLPRELPNDQLSLDTWPARTPNLNQECSSEKKMHRNSRESSGLPAGCPWDTRRDKQESTGRCPADFLFFFLQKLTEVGIFFRVGTPAGCPWSKRFSETSPFNCS